MIPTWTPFGALIQRYRIAALAGAKTEVVVHSGPVRNPAQETRVTPVPSALCPSGSRQILVMGGKFFHQACCWSLPMSATR